jgi:hypothetical protein
MVPILECTAPPARRSKAVHDHDHDHEDDHGDEGR